MRLLAVVMIYGKINSPWFEGRRSKSLRHPSSLKAMRTSPFSALPAKYADGPASVLCDEYEGLSTSPVITPALVSMVIDRLFPGV